MIWLTLLLMAGVYMILLSMIMKTKEWLAFFIYKVTPFFLGLATLLYSIKELGWI